MGEFEDNLLRDLVARHGDALAAAPPPAPAPSRRRPTARLLVAVLIVVVIVGGLVVGSDVLGQSSSAYAVTMNADGTVTVSLQDIRAIDPANARLRALGVRAKVVPMTENCSAVDGPHFPGPYKPSYFPAKGPGNSISMGTDIPPGWTMLLFIDPRPGRGTGLGFTGLRKDPAPDCILDPVLDQARSAGGR